MHLVRLSFRSTAPTQVLAGVPGLRDVEVQAPMAGADGATVITATLTGDPRPLLEALLPHDLVDFESRRPSLEELFLAYYDAEGPDTGSGVSG